MSVASPLLRRRSMVVHHCVWLAGSCFVIVAAFLLEVRGTEQVGPSATPGFVLPTLCMVRGAFGVNCPGCGLTRSFIYLAQGDVWASWEMHRLGFFLAGLVVLQIPYRIYRLARPRGFRLSYRMINWLGFGFAGLLIANWVVGMIW